MTSVGIFQIAVFFGLILICARPLGAYMARVFEGQRTFMHPVLRWLEALTYKVAGIREAIEAVGAELRYLPPYSPDLNPIESAFAKFKKLLRDAVQQASGAKSET